MRILRAGICKDSNELRVTHAGFTFLELIIVIFIVSLVLALSLPSFTGMGESRIKSDSKRIASIIRYLNDSAISAKDTLQMKFNFKDRSLNYTGPEGEKSESFDSLSGVELQSRGMVSEGEVIIFFSPMGALENFTVHLRDDGSTMAVALNSVNGRVKIIQNEE